MTEPVPEIALTAEEVDEILAQCGSHALLVGGQALALWSAVYKVTPPEILAASISSDADFIGSAGHCGSENGGRPATRGDTHFSLWHRPARVASVGRTGEPITEPAAYSGETPCRRHRPGTPRDRDREELSTDPARASSSSPESVTSCESAFAVSAERNSLQRSGGPGAIVDGGCLRVLVTRNCESAVVVRRGWLHSIPNRVQSGQK